MGIRTYRVTFLATIPFSAKNVSLNVGTLVAALCLVNGLLGRDACILEIVATNILGGGRPATVRLGESEIDYPIKANASKLCSERAERSSKSRRLEQKSRLLLPNYSITSIVAFG
jgi:hypothetical protein